jgi:cell division ATPase FtsA
MLIVEVQSSLARASVARVSPGMHAAEMLHSENAPIAYTPGGDTARYSDTAISAVRAAVDAALRAHASLRAEDATIGQIDEVHFVLSSPWIVSQAKTVTMSFDRETAVTDSVIRKVLDDERREAGFTDASDMAVVEEKVFDVKLNGYSVLSWKKKPARTIEISCSVSVGSASSMKRFREIVAHIPGGRHPVFHSSLLLQYMSLRGAHVSTGSHMLVHVHGELTDMVATRHGSCSFFGSYPIGANTVARTIGDEMHVDDRSAESLLSLYMSDHLEASNKARVAGAVEGVAGAWSRELARLWQTSGAASMPESVFLIAHARGDLFHSCLTALYPRSDVRPLVVDMTATYASSIASL